MGAKIIKKWDKHHFGHGAPCSELGCPSPLFPRPDNASAIPTRGKMLTRPKSFAVRISFAFSISANILQGSIEKKLPHY